MLLELGIEAVWAAQPEDLSLLHVLFYIHSAGSLDLLFETEGGAQQERFVGGSQRVALRMAEELGERIVLGAPVRRIEHGPDGVTVHADGALARGRRVLVAIAPTLAGRIGYDPPLSGYRDQLTQRMPMGTVVKCMAVYDEPFWRSEGLSGQGDERHRAGQGHERQLAAGRRRRASCSASSRAATRASSGAPPPRGGAPPSSTPSRVCSARGRPSPTRTSRSSGRRRSSRAAATAATCRPGPGRATGARCAPPIGPLHWAGAEYATVWNGYMDGAVRSGEAAARELLARL